MRNRLQQRVVSGRLTLPIAFVIFTTLWIISLFAVNTNITYPESAVWEAIGRSDFIGSVAVFLNYLVYGFTGYLLLEMNNAYSIIRVRTSFQCAVFALLIAACPFLFAIQPGSVANTLLFIGIYYLFRTYQRLKPEKYIFQAFLFIGLGSLLFPPLFYYIPLLLIGMYHFKSLSFRSFSAGIIGLALPYLFLLAYAFYNEKMEWFYLPFIELFRFYPINYQTIDIHLILSTVFIILLFLTSAVHRLFSAFQDKIRAASYLNFIVLLIMATILFCVLQPIYISVFLPILITGSSLLIGRFFVVATTKASNVFFIIVGTLLIMLAIYNLWIH